MKILFCNIAYMKYYKGIFRGIDEPRYGGEYVLRENDAAEKYNFTPFETQNGYSCFGYVETKSTNKRSSNQLHIERIEGVPQHDELAEGVLVVWCAKYHDNRTVVVGWYKNATVYRYYQKNIYDYYYNIEAAADDCVLLPEGQRNFHIWQVPRKRVTRSFGFGQANVWYANEESAADYVKKIETQIENYDGENWLRNYPADIMHEILKNSVKDMSTEELANMLDTVGISHKGEKEALIDKVVEAIMDGKLKFDDEEGTAEEIKDDIDEIFDFDKPEATEARVNAARELNKRIREQYDAGEISIDEMEKYIEYFYVPNKEVSDQTTLDYYVVCRCALIDDEGKENKIGTLYKINGKYACCGRFLDYSEELGKYGCGLCGNIYEV